MSSKAFSGKGTVLAIGSTPTPIAELKTFKMSGQANQTEDVTNSDSPGRAREFIVTLFDTGTIDVSGNYIPTDAGQTQLQSARDGGTIAAFTLTLAKSATQTTSGDKFTFSGLVTKYDLDAQFDKSITFSCTLKVSGVITYTPGT
jgi:predicted secreted protein